MEAVITMIFGLAGGLALFLYGIRILSNGLQKIAGRKMKDVLEKVTGNRLKGVASGAVTTAAVQSSSLTTVTLVCFVNSGLISLRNAVPVIMGAEIGTTITAQLVAFKIGAFSLPVIAVGFLLFTIGRNKHKYTGHIILGFGLLFLGMNTMSAGVAPLKTDPYLMGILTSFGDVPILGVLAGAVFTGLIQSSSATSGLVIALGMEGAIGLMPAISIILGANIGTCITVIIASAGMSLSGKRTAAVHAMFNVLGVMILLPLIVPFSSLVAMTSDDLPRQIANAHALFNISMTALFLPFAGAFTGIVMRIVPGKDVSIRRGVQFLDDNVMKTPSVALSLAMKETMGMAHITTRMIDRCKKALIEGDEKSIDIVCMKEEVVDELYKEISKYLTKISETDMSEDQSHMMIMLMHATSDIERVADHCYGLAKMSRVMKDKDMEFSAAAKKDVLKILRKSRLSYVKAVKTLETGDRKKGNEVYILEDEIDRLKKVLEKNHYERLEKETCKPEAGSIYIKVIRRLERISDHAQNIATAVVME